VAAEPAPDTDRSRSGRYARWAVARRWHITVTWVVGLAVLVLTPSVGSGGDELASIIPLDSPAIRAELRSVQEFGFPLSSRTVVVQRDPSGLSPFVQAESVLDALAIDQGSPDPPLLGALPVTNTLRLGGRPGETNTTVLTYLFMNPTSSFASQRHAAERYIDDKLDRPEDHVVGVAGSVPARAEQAGLVHEYLPRLELLTVLAILVLVGFTFRSVAPPLIALLASGAAFVVTIHTSRVLGAVLGIATPAELEPLLVALLLGVVTDYTIFYVTALQVRLRDSGEQDATVSAIATYTPIVLVAGLTVSAGTAALLAATSEFFQGFGPAMALAILVGLVVSVTLVPALLAILGRRTFWPGPPPAGRATLTRRWVRAVTGGRRLRVIDHLTDRRVAAGVLLGCVGLLVLAAAPIRSLDLGVRFTSSLPADSTVTVASEAAAAGFAPGITSPTTVLIEGEDVTSDLRALSRFQGMLALQPGVAGIVGPAQNITQRAHGVVLSNSGNAARMLLVFDNDPLDAPAIDDLTLLREEIPELAARAGLGDARVSLAGDTALAEGLVTSTGRDLYRIAIAGIAVNLLLLIIFLRSLVAPLYLLASSVLALAASLGLTVWLFMDELGHTGLTFYIPFAAAVLLVSLGSDYNIFGVGRVWDEARNLPLRDAIRKAVPESTRAITAAGVTLAVSFGMLAIIPLGPFREMAIAMAVGILLDALLVRSLMLPSLLTLVGPVSGWPRSHLRAEMPPDDDGAAEEADVDDRETSVP
jgi:RND superfamily putative drug exporter